MSFFVCINPLSSDGILTYGHKKSVLLTYEANRTDVWLTQESQKPTCCNCRPDYTGHIRPHCVHEQLVAAVVLQAELVGYSGGHRHCRHTGVAYERVYLLAFGQ